MDHVSWSLGLFQKPPLGGTPNTKLGDHGTPNTYNSWFILLYHVWGPAWIFIDWNSIQFRAHSHMIPDYIWGSVTTLHTWFWRCVGTAIGHLSFGLSQFHGHGSWACVKWPLGAGLHYVPGCCKSNNWLLKSSQDDFGLHQEKIGIVTIEVKVLKIHFSRHNKCIGMVWAQSYGSYVGWHIKHHSNDESSLCWKERN